MAFLLYPSSKHSNNRIKLFTSSGKDQTRLFSYVSYLSPSGTSCDLGPLTPLSSMYEERNQSGDHYHPRIHKQKKPYLDLQESVKGVGKV